MDKKLECNECKSTNFIVLNFEAGAIQCDECKQKYFTNRATIFELENNT